MIESGIVIGSRDTPTPLPLLCVKILQWFIILLTSSLLQTRYSSPLPPFLKRKNYTKHATGPVLKPQNVWEELRSLLLVYAELIDPGASIQAGFRHQYLPVNPLSIVFACLLRYSKGLYEKEDFSVVNGNK